MYLNCVKLHEENVKRFYNVKFKGRIEFYLFLLKSIKSSLLVFPITMAEIRTKIQTNLIKSEGIYFEIYQPASC